MNIRKASNRFLKMTKGKLTFRLRLGYYDHFPKRKKTMRSFLNEIIDIP